MKFINTATCRDERFSIGQETESERYYLSIPVSNRMVDYLEYYEIDQAVHDAYPDNHAQLSAFAKACRTRQKDELLKVAPGTDRGIA